MILTLKEAFQLQKTFQNIIRKLGYPRMSQYAIENKEIHRYKEGGVDQEDKVNVVAKQDYNVMVLIDMAQNILEQQQKLSDLIYKAKCSAELDIDSAKFMNIQKTAFLSSITELMTVKDEERETSGSIFLKDAEGKQARFVYPITIVTSYNCDKNAVKAIYKRLQKECDETSKKIDQVLVNTTFEFDTIYDVHDDMNSAYEKFFEATLKEI